MIRRPTLFFCIAALLVGIFIGSAFDSWPLTATVQANALSLDDAEKLYRELGSASNTLVEGSRLLSKVAQLMTPSVVHIKSERKTPRGGMIEETGSGIIVTSSQMRGQFVITNRHVIDGSEKEDISVFLHDGRVVRPSRIWSDQATDVAVLRIVADGLQPAHWGNSDDVEIGHMVLAMGSPFGLSHSVTYGIISAKGRRSLRLGKSGAVLNQDFLQTDAAINPGNSGGPLVDLHASVIGINTAIASNSGGNDGIGFSIPSNLARRVADELLAHGRVHRAYLGVKLDSNFDADAASRLKLDRTRGARVVRVFDGTPAASASLQYDDVILRFDGILVQDENHLINLVSLTSVGTTVKLVVFRKGRKLTIEVVLTDRPEHDLRSEAIPNRPGNGALIAPMGLTLHRLDPSTAGQLGFSESSRGLLVLSIDADSSLSGDIQLYDLIEEVARTPIRSANDLSRVLDSQRPDSPLVLKVRRRVNGRQQSSLVVWQR